MEFRELATRVIVVGGKPQPCRVYEGIADVARRQETKPNRERPLPVGGGLFYFRHAFWTPEDLAAELGR